MKTTPHRETVARQEPCPTSYFEKRCSRESYGQVLLHDGLVQVRDGAFRDNRAAVHDVKAVGHAQAEIQILLHEQDADLPFLPDPYERLADLINDVRLDAFRGLVEDEDLGIAEHGAGDGELLLLAAAENAAFALEHFLENGKQIEHAINLSIRLRAAHDEADLQIFPDRQVRKNIAALRNITNPLARAFIGAQSFNRGVGQAYASAHGLKQADDALEGGGLAHAVAAHKTDHLPLRHRERNVPQDLRAVVSGVQLGDSQHGGAGGHK